MRRSSRPMAIATTDDEPLPRCNPLGGFSSSPNISLHVGSPGIAASPSTPVRTKSFSNVSDNGRGGGSSGLSGSSNWGADFGGFVECEASPKHAQPPDEEKIRTINGAKRELLETERTYAAAITSLIDHFRRWSFANVLPPPGDVVHSYIANLKSVHVCNVMLLYRLEEHARRCTPVGETEPEWDRIRWGEIYDFYELSKYSAYIPCVDPLSDFCEELKPKSPDGSPTKGAVSLSEIEEITSLIYFPYKRLIDYKNMLDAILKWEVVPPTLTVEELRELSGVRTLVDGILQTANAVLRGKEEAGGRRKRTLSGIKQMLTGLTDAWSKTAQDYYVRDGVLTIVTKHKTQRAYQLLDLDYPLKPKQNILPISYLDPVTKQQKSQHFVCSSQEVAQQWANDISGHGYRAKGRSPSCQQVAALRFPPNSPPSPTNAAANAAALNSFSFGTPPSPREKPSHHPHIHHHNHHNHNPPPSPRTPRKLSEIIPFGRPRAKSAQFEWIGTPATPDQRRYEEQKHREQ